MDQKNTQIVIYFDGVCNLCNFFVDFVIQRDPEGLFLFAPLQGVTAQKQLGEHSQQLKSVLVKTEDNLILKESDAVLFVLKRLSRGWALFSCLAKILPGFFRDWIYKKIAENRYSLFGKRDNCRLPTRGEAQRFLD